MVEEDLGGFWEEEGSSLWSVVPLISPFVRPLVIGTSPLVVVLGFSSEEEGRFSKRMVERSRLSIGPLEIWSVSTASSVICSRLPRG